SRNHGPAAPRSPGLTTVVAAAAAGRGPMPQTESVAAKVRPASAGTRVFLPCRTACSGMGDVLSADLPLRGFRAGATPSHSRGRPHARPAGHDSDAGRAADGARG